MVAAVVVSACGGGGTAAPLSHDQLVSQADRLCAAYSSELTKVFAHADSVAAADSAYDAYLERFDHLIKDLRALRPPVGDSKAYRAWLEAAVSQRPLIEATRPPAAEADTGRLWFAISRVDHLAAGLGMWDCATSVDRNQVPMTRSSYAQVADSVCYSAGAAFKLLPKPDGLAAFSNEIDQLEPVFEETQRDLHAIPVPSGDEGELGAWLRIRDRTAREILLMRDAADAGDLTTFKRLSGQVNADAQRGRSIAGEYGMTQCGGQPLS